MKDMFNKVINTFKSIFNSQIFKSIIIVLISAIFLYFVVEILNGSFGMYIINIFKQAIFDLPFSDSLAFFSYYFSSRIHMLINLLLIIAIILLIYGLIGRLRLSIGISSILLFLFGLIDHILITIRATPFVPSDIFSISLAAKMAGNFNFTISSALIAAFVLLLLFVFLYKIKKLVVPKIKLIIFRLVSICLSTTIFILFFATNVFSVTMYWDTLSSYRNNGLLVSFFSAAKSLHITEPVGYSIDSIEYFIDENNSENTTDTSSSEAPNIIAIMNESFADLEEIYNLNLTEDNMPFIHSLSENTIIGRAHSSSLGCKTANCEFEFLTRKFY